MVLDGLCGMDEQSSIFSTAVHLPDIVIAMKLSFFAVEEFLESGDICRMDWPVCFPNLNLVEQDCGDAWWQDRILRRTPDYCNKCSLKSETSYLKNYWIVLSMDRRKIFN
ncbi:hypothetical protein TNCV_2360151 [Trichonephila clavipes]|nr:hypothetical protein TNCV_2360151 [Trichonephila clavipes]